MIQLLCPLGKKIIIEGWAIDFLAAEPAKAVLVFVDNKKIYQTIYGLEDFWAVARLSDMKYRFCGFGVLIPTADLSTGLHHVLIKVVSHDGQTLYSADKEIKVTVQ